ncbi:MAG TPA: hypothetical protein VKA09_08890 [Nitrososphaeraceae archaeon]|nr:hypothetical protein [Nitrososphaeraceae archaeon]
MTSLQQSSSVKEISKWRTVGARLNEEDLSGAMEGQVPTVMETKEIN